MVGNDVNLKISRTNTHEARAKLISNTHKTANKPFIARSLQYLGVTVFSTTKRRRGPRINTDRFPKRERRRRKLLGESVPNLCAVSKNLTPGTINPW